MQVSLHSCRGRWGGCIPEVAPALIYHHGHRHKDFRLMEVVGAWLQLAWTFEADPNVDSEVPYTPRSLEVSRAAQSASWLWAASRDWDPNLKVKRSMCKASSKPRGS